MTDPSPVEAGAVALDAAQLSLASPTQATAVLSTTLAASPEQQVSSLAKTCDNTSHDTSHTTIKPNQPEQEEQQDEEAERDEAKDEDKEEELVKLLQEKLASDTPPTPDTSEEHDPVLIPQTFHQFQLFYEPSNPQLIPDKNPPQDHNDPQQGAILHPPKDAWADQGHFPLLLSEISRRSIPVRGGSRVVLSGVNFREGVEVVFACPQLSDSTVEAKVVTPRVRMSSEMEITTPNLLDWWILSNSTHPCKELVLSVSLICAGATDEADIDTTFSMVAVEESETELLHVIISLHRQLILNNLTTTLDREGDHSKQRTLTLLNLEQPPSVTRSEHLALGVIYMLCDGHDQISAEGAGILRATTEDGHDMLHLAVIRGLTTLVREISRHLLAWFQSRPITLDSEIFTRNANHETALDFAKTLGQNEIEQVLTGILKAAQEFKKTMLHMPPRLPTTSRPGSMVESSNGRMYLSPIPTLPAQVLNRPLPPTPLTSPFREPGAEASQRPVSYFPAATSSDGTMRSQDLQILSNEPGASVATVQQQSLARTSTAQVIVEDSHGSPASSHSSHETALGRAHTLQHGVPVTDSPESSVSATYTSQVTPAPLQEPPYEYHYWQPVGQQQHPVTASLPHQLSASSLPAPSPHNIPPPRANSAPHLHPGFPPPLPSSRPHNPQGQQPVQAIHRSSVSQVRSLPATPHPPAAPLPPPKHKVTRVNRPKQFTVRTTAVQSTELPQLQSQSQPVPVGYAYPQPGQHQYQQHQQHQQQQQQHSMLVPQHRISIHHSSQPLLVQQQQQHQVTMPMQQQAFLIQQHPTFTPMQHQLQHQQQHVSAPQHHLIPASTPTQHQEKESIAHRQGPQGESPDGQIKVQVG